MKTILAAVIGWWCKMLASYNYYGHQSFFESLAPSFRYKVTMPGILLSVVYTPLAAAAALMFPAIEASIGISGAAFIAMFVAFAVELLSGLMASRVSRQQFSSHRLSRFSFKVFVYFVIIAMPYHWAQNFNAKHNVFMSAVFEWLQNFLIMQVAFENIVSILENVSVITGQEKTAWINKIKEFLSSKISNS